MSADLPGWFANTLTEFPVANVLLWATQNDLVSGNYFNVMDSGLLIYNQHPGRSADTFSNKLDNFSALVIHLSLSAISENPTLWDKYNGGDPDCLILRKKDFLNLDSSPVFKELTAMRNKKIKRFSYDKEKMLSKLESQLSGFPHEYKRLRSADTFSNKLDNFSALVIHLSLSAISENPTL